MSRNQRIGLVVGALVVAVVAFLIARPGDDDDNGSERAAQTAPAQTETGAADERAETQTETEAPEPEISRIRVRGGTVVGGVQRVQANKGDTVRIVVTSDAPDEIHLHGYDIYEDTAPGKPARFVFRADIEGIFEIESHEAEEAGRDPLLARLVVEPS